MIISTLDIMMNISMDYKHKENFPLFQVFQPLHELTEELLYKGTM